MHRDCTRKWCVFPQAIVICDANRSIALSYAKENSLFEGGDREVSVTQLEWLYLATYNVALKLINSSGFLSATHALDHSRDVCFDQAKFLLGYVLLTSFQFALQHRQIEYPEGGSKAPRPHLFSVIYLRLLVSTLRARCADPTAKVSYINSCLQHIIPRKCCNVIVP